MLAAPLDEAVEHSAAPGAVALALERLADAHNDFAERLADPAFPRALVAVLGASRSLTELCVADPGALDVLAALGRRPTLETGDAGSLRRWKQLELLRIAARDLLGIDDMPAVGRALAAMASDVLEAACRLAGTPGLAVIGMGKLGAAELNYASDIDLMFVGEDDSCITAARKIMDIARRCFRVDANLRPEGRDGPLVRSLESYRAYWQRWASTWEFQALIKARPVAGHRPLGAAFLAAAQAEVWDRPFGPDALHSIRSLKARAEQELARRGLTEREIKRGRGGIRDIEFSIQLLQLVHGGQDPGLRLPGTLDALAELTNAGYIESQDGRTLDAAYRFLRTVEHRLQLVDEQQVHAIPTSADAQTRLARVMGYRDQPGAGARQHFMETLRREQATVRTIHERLFFRPLLDALVADPATTVLLTPAAAAARLAAFGFRDAERTRQALRELTKGLTRSSRLMKQILPLLLSWLSESPDPDLGILALRRLSSGRQRTTELATAFRESPEAARRLCVLLGTSRMAGEVLEHHPDLVPSLADSAALAPRSRTELLAAAETAMGLRADMTARQPFLQRFANRQRVRIVARDVLELRPDQREAVAATAADLTALAEATLETALRALSPDLPFAVIAMGRFGGAELSYASDLDVLFVYEGRDATHFDHAEHLARALVRFVKGSTPAARIHDVDVDLRPEGKQGPLARSLDGYAAYYERWAQTWERQALLKARPVAGDAELGQRFMKLVEPYVWSPLSDDEVREIRHMKARIERERIPAGEDPQFHLKLGRGSLSDVEFTAQLLQLVHGVRGTGTMATLDALAGLEVLAADDHDALAAAYRFCEHTRNRWFLIKGSQGDSLPTAPEMLSRLSRSLDTTPAELRERYRRFTRRSRSVVQRLFYGATDPPA